MVEFGQATGLSLSPGLSWAVQLVTVVSLWWVSGSREHTGEPYGRKSFSISLGSTIQIRPRGFLPSEKQAPFHGLLCCSGHRVYVYVVGLDFSAEPHSKLHHHESSVSVCFHSPVAFNQVNKYWSFFTVTIEPYRIPVGMHHTLGLSSQFADRVYGA